MTSIPHLPLYKQSVHGGIARGDSGRRSVTLLQMTAAASPAECSQGLQMVVSSYEARQEELIQENKGLQAALADLQSDYRALANKQAVAQQLQATAVRNLVEEEDLQEVLQASDAAQVQAELSAKMAAMKEKIERVYDGPMQQVYAFILHSE